MLRQLPIIDPNGKKKRIAVSPHQISFIEELTPNKCNIVIEIQEKELVFLCPKPYSYLINFTNLTSFNLFADN